MGGRGERLRRRLALRRRGRRGERRRSGVGGSRDVPRAWGRLRGLQQPPRAGVRLGAGAPVDCGGAASAQRNPPLYEPMHLDVPSGLPPPCCPCPDHNTNVVRTCYVSGRLSVLDANGLPFRETAVSCDVYVGGVVPSAEVGDARLMFSRGGQICAEQRRTVFGVGISSVADGVDLAALNVFAPDFGLPVAPGTNAPAANLNLDLKTMMTHGRVRLSVEGATARFVVAFRSPHDGAWHVLADSARQPVRDMPVQQWRRLFARGRRDAAGQDRQEGAFPSHLQAGRRVGNGIGQTGFQDRQGRLREAHLPAHQGVRDG